MSFLRKLASHTAIYGLSSIIGRLLNWALTPVYVNFFRPEEFGIFSDLYAMMFYPLILLSFGMETTFFRYAKNYLASDKAFSNALSVVITFVAVFLGFSLTFLENIAEVLGYPGQEKLLLPVIGIIALDTVANLFMAFLRYKEKAWKFALTSLTNILITLVLNIIFIAVLRLDYYYAFLANLIASAVRLLLAVGFNLPLRFSPDKEFLRPMLSYAAPIVIAGLAGAINETLDRNLLPRLWEDGKVFLGKARSGTEMNGIYAANYKLAIFISLFTQAFRYAAEPFFFKNLKKTTDNKKQIAVSYYFFLLIALSGFVWISVLKYFIVSFNFFGLVHFRLIPEPYWVGLPVVPVLLFANVSLASYVTFSMWFKISEQTQYGIYFSLAGASITLAMNFLFIPKIGFYASALATLLCYVTMAVFCVYVGQKKYFIPYDFKQIFKSVFLAIFLVVTYQFLENYKGLGAENFGFAILTIFIWSGWVYREARKYNQKRWSNG